MRVVPVMQSTQGKNNDKANFGLKAIWFDTPETLNTIRKVVIPDSFKSLANLNTMEFYKLAIQRLIKRKVVKEKELSSWFIDYNGLTKSLKSSTLNGKYLELVARLNDSRKITKETVGRILSLKLEQNKVQQELQHLKKSRKNPFTDIRILIKEAILNKINKELGWVSEL